MEPVKGAAMIGQADRVIHQALQQFDDAHIEVVESKSALRSALNEAIMLVISNSQYDVDVAKILAEAPKLQWIQFSSTGYDGATKYGAPKGVVVTNARGIWAKTVAEHAMALLLALVRRLGEIHELQQAKRWDRTGVAQHLQSLEGKRTAIVGYGAIGQDLARKLKAFDVHVVAVNRTGIAEQGGWHDECRPVSQLKEVLPLVDVVAVCAPLTPETYHLLSVEEFQVIKEGCLVINVGRGPIIDEPALIDALNRGRIGGCGLDVAKVEPLPVESPLWRYENVIISPHVGGFGGKAGDHFLSLFRENFRRFREKLPLLNRVEIDPEVRRVT